MDSFVCLLLWDDKPEEVVKDLVRTAVCTLEEGRFQALGNAKQAKRL